MVRSDGVDDDRVLALPAQQVGAYAGVAAVDLHADALAYVVEEPDAPGEGYVQTKLAGHRPHQA